MRRFLILFFLSLFSGISVANDALWKCEQSKDSKEWVCVGDKKQDKKIADSKLPEDTETAQTAEPAFASPIPKSPAPEVEPVQAAQPALPEPAAIEQPTVAEAVEGIKPVIPVSKKPQPENVQAREASKRTPGWTCNTNEQGENWNCNLVGADPKGEARIVETNERKFSLLEPAFDFKEEQVFKTLSSQLKYDPWANCTIEMGPRPSFIPGKHLRETSPLDVKSDYSEIFDNEIGSYTGNVEISRADQHSFSNAANYDSISETLDLHGDVYYSEDELALYSNTATLKLASDEARLRNVMFIDPATPLRGRAQTVYRDSKTLSRYKDVAYTSCPPNNQDWIVHASDLKLNDETGKGAAKNAWLEFKGLPVFYSPYLSFPMDDRRLSGFLAPSFGSTQQSGFDFSVPYYWNIAPNYDATLKPRYLTDRGILLGGDFRLLTKYSNSIASLEYMPNDRLRDDSRFLGSFENYSHIGKNLSSNMDLNYVSDKDYFSELGNALSFPNFSFVRSTADVSYNDEGILFSTRLVNYQTIDKTLTGFRSPYRRLPEVDLNLDHSFDFMPLKTAMESEYVLFQHDVIVNGQRFNIKPSVSVPWKSEAAFLTPKVSVQHTDYQISKQNPGRLGTNPDPALPAFIWNTGSDTITRTLPILSVDSGIYAEREFDIADSPIKHTIEPRLFYLYIPKDNQDDIPIFDTSVYDFWYSNLFRENRFSGSDRVQDANQITAALTSRLVDPASGREWLKFDIGEILYLRDREVTAPVRINFPGAVQIPDGYLASPPETDTLSPLVAELSSRFTSHLSAETGIQWNPRTNDIVRGRAILHYVNQPEQIINLGFNYRKDPTIKRVLDFNRDVIDRYNFDPNYDPFTDETVIRRNDIILSDASFRWPLVTNWYAVGRWQYSWLYNNTQEAFLGLEHENCCWRFRVIGRQFVNNVNSVNNPLTPTQLAEGESQTGIFFQLELKGLTGIGQKLDKFFEQSIYGYRSPKK